MIPGQALILDLPQGPLRFEHLPAPVVATIFTLVAIPIIRLGVGTLRWQSPARAWTSIGVRLSAVWVVLMILAGARWERENKDLEVVVLRDVSASTAAVRQAAHCTLGDTIDDYLRSASSHKRKGDRIGVVSFDDRALIDLLPDTRLRLDGRAVRDDRGGGTDLAAGVQLGLACFGRDAMRRMVIITDGNATQGDTETALNAASAAGVSVDVVPLHYRVDGEVILDRLTAPAIRREGDSFNVEAVLRSSHTQTVHGWLDFRDRGRPIDLDLRTPGLQAAVAVEVPPGSRGVSVRIPPLETGTHTLTATFTPRSRADDELSRNNTADALTFITGRTRVLYVDSEPSGHGRHLLDALRADGIVVKDEDHIVPEAFPTSVAELQSYHAVVLANVPRGPGGLGAAQERALVQYVRDLAGGLVVIGGPDALGAGQWQHSRLETILPVEMDPPAERNVPPGALMLVLDHSGSMSDPLSGGSRQSKQTVANESAVLAIESLGTHDFVGVVAFDNAPITVSPLARNTNPAMTSNQIRCLTPGGGTYIYPALLQAYDAMNRLPLRDAQVRHVLLMTDGVSGEGDFDGLLARMADAKITLSTIAFGADADRELLSKLARRGGGMSYVVTDAKQLPQVFLREARTLRRPIVHEPPGGISLLSALFPPSGTPGAGRGEGLFTNAFPPLSGIVLTASKPGATVSIRSAEQTRDPVLATWRIGLGRATVFTGDATSRWARQWIASPTYAKFWPAVVRDVTRPPPSGDFNVRTIRDGQRTRLIVEASKPNGDPRNFLKFTGNLAGPDSRLDSASLRLEQTGPGRYESDLSTPDSGAYIAAVRYADPSGDDGTLITGTIVPSAPELRDLRSNDDFASQATQITGGRVLRAFDDGKSLFDRSEIRPSVSSRPIRELLLITLMSIILFDVAVRRIAWDWVGMKKMLAVVGQHAQTFLTTRTCEPLVMLATLRDVRRQTREQYNRQPMIPPSGVSTDPKSVEHYAFPTTPTDQTTSLWAAKRRAMETIREKGQN